MPVRLEVGYMHQHPNIQHSNYILYLVESSVHGGLHGTLIGRIGVRGGTLHEPSIGSTLLQLWCVYIWYSTYS